MEHPFNNLSPAEAERLDWLVEECAEVIQAAQKIKRHGYKSFNPNKPQFNNRHDLEREISHLMLSTALLLKSEDIREFSSSKFANEKIKQLEQTNYFHHNDVIGILKE